MIFSPGMAGQRLGADVDLDAGDDAGLGQDLDEGRAVVRLLADRLVVEDHAADAVAEPGRGDEQFAIGAPRLLGLRNPRGGEALVAGGVALVHREQALAAGDQLARGLDELLRVHVEAPHFQFRISGRSSPCSSM